MSIEEIRSVFRAENAAMLDTTMQRLENMHAAMMERALQRLEGSNAAMLESTVQKLENVIDVKLDGQETRLMKEISALQKRTDQLEHRVNDRAGESGDPVVQDAKRGRWSFSAESGSDGMGSNARDHAEMRHHEEVEEHHTVVFSGFPAKSRKKPVID